VTGDIDMSTSPSFRKALLESLGKTARLAVNLTDVRYVDSSGIAFLVEVLKAARNLDPVSFYHFPHRLLFVGSTRGQVEKRSHGALAIASARFLTPPKTSRRKP
jgi:hypothetical protein